MLKPSPYEDVLHALDEMLELWERKRTNSVTMRDSLLHGKYGGHGVNAPYEDGLQKAYGDCVANLKAVIERISK